ncbi:hypothetical protein EC957_005128 [Mortierella hygrophila]|uniref:Glycosyltransferase 61 catalytic domain-containing protein n=1 Tax=Mortierella hygrophila TaxID=979708 RepID=A0A9P6JZW7_9FUNG|nr:hypothetical protein EC957_005128 [Mortierella hygrophila]
MLPFESAIPAWVAGCSCIFFATLFVGSLYLFPVKKQAPTGNHATDRSQQRLDRDHPLVIKQRIKGIVLTSVLITLYLWVVFSISGAIPFDQASQRVCAFLQLLGLTVPACGFAQWLHHIFTPLALVVILFLGPLVMMLIDSELPFQSRFYWKNQLQNLREWIGIRNYIVGPIAEEYIFRACMVSITATSGASPKAMIFGLPLVFGIGTFIRSNGIRPRKNLPKVNLMSADAEADVFCTMKRFGGTKNSWTFRAGRFFYDPIGRMGAWEMDHFFETGKELVLAQSELSTPFQTLPPEDTPICFRRAVIGLSSQCGLDYCENNAPAEVYKSFQEEIAEYYRPTPLTWEKHVKSAQESINRTQEKEQTHKYGQDKIEAQEQEVEKKNAAKSQLGCLDLARYYNFESAGPNHGIENGEAKSRVGQMHPDIVDPAETYQNLFVEGKEGEAQGEQTQREGSRRLVNDEELIQGLVQSGFRVKWITFDHGCGIAETAYLLGDINVLISPHGNALGTSIFMPNHEAVPTVISVDTARYHEPWFKFTTTAIGQRFIRTVCGPTNYVDEVSREYCPYFKDLKGAWDIMSSHSLVLGLPDSMVKTDKQKESMSGDERDKLRDASREYVKNNPAAQKLAEQEMDILTGPEMPVSIIQKYGEIAYEFMGVYWKGSPRYVDDLEQEKIKESAAITTTTTTIKQQSGSTGAAQKSYRPFVEYVRKGQACGPDDCEGILGRNVANEKTNAFGKHSVDDISKWGQPTSKSEALRAGLTTEVLQRTWQIEA